MSGGQCPPSSNKEKTRTGNNTGCPFLVRQDSFQRLRSVNALMSFSACEREVVLNCFSILFRDLFKSSSTGNALLLVRSHVACILQPRKTMPAMKASLFKGQQPGKKTQEEIPKAMGKNQAKTENMEIVLNGPRKASVGQETRPALSTIKQKRNGKRRRARSTSGTTSQDPKVQVRQESETSRCAATFQMEQRYARANVDGGPPVMAS